MVITIYLGYEKTTVLLGSRNGKFRHAWGHMEVKVSELYEYMSQIATWCTNTVGEECIFEVE